MLYTYPPSPPDQLTMAHNRQERNIHEYSAGRSKDPRTCIVVAIVVRAIVMLLLMTTTTMMMTVLLLLLLMRLLLTLMLLLLRSFVIAFDALVITVIIIHRHRHARHTHTHSHNLSYPKLVQCHILPPYISYQYYHTPPTHHSSTTAITTTSDTTTIIATLHQHKPQRHITQPHHPYHNKSSS